MPVRGSECAAPRSTDGPPVEFHLAAGLHAPAVAREAVGSVLNGSRGNTFLLETATLVVSELVTNSVRHSGAAAGQALVLRIALSPAGMHLEVEDPGSGGAIAARSPNLDGGGGLGLHLVEVLSECWGVERAPGGGTRVWAQIQRGSGERAPVPVAAIGDDG